MSTIVGTDRKPGAGTNLWKHLYCWALILLDLFPIYIVVISAFDPTGSLASSSLVPKHWDMKNFKLLFVNNGSIPYTTWLWNSIMIAAVTAVISTAIGAAAAYALARLRFRGRKVALNTILMVQVFPSFLALAAIYRMMEQVYVVFPSFGLGSTWGLILIYLGSSMGVNAWLLKGFLDSIPADLDEAAAIDGASPTQTFWLVVAPLMAPVLAVTAVLSFIGTFNEFVLASFFLTDVNQRTVAVGLQAFVGAQFGQNWGPFAAGSLIASIPMVILFLSFQRYIVSGLTGGATKG